MTRKETLAAHSYTYLVVLKETISVTRKELGVGLSFPCTNKKSAIDDSVIICSCQMYSLVSSKDFFFFVCN